MIQNGLGLIAEFDRFIEEAKPRYWAMENVSNLEQWWPSPPIWRFKISIGGRRTLWGNISIPLSPEFKINRGMAIGREKRRQWKEQGKTDIRDLAKRAMIPYPIARFIADTVKNLVKMRKP